MRRLSCSLLLSTRRRRSALTCSPIFSSTRPAPPPRSVSSPRPAPLILLNLHQRYRCFTSTIKNAPSSGDEVSESCSTQAKKSMTLEVEIISKGNIKPASPTPVHLRTYKLSGLDQLFPHIYSPLVFFYPNNQSTDLTDVFHERSQRLRQSLSQTLSRFYPFAGKVGPELHIECNDEGVYYVEACVNNCLSNFLKQPNYKLIHQLLPYDPNSVESMSKTCLVMIQVNFFNCGGVAITICTSHKIIDGPTYAVFLKAWAAMAHGSSEEVYPSFIAPSFFPQNRLLAKGSSIVMLPSKFKQAKCVTRRIVFDASALVALKAKASISSAVQKPSRVVAVATLIWKCAMAASRARSYGSQRPSILSLAVNLRSRCLPPLPQYLIGNAVWGAVAHCMPNTELQLHSLADDLSNAIAKINNDFVEEIKGEAGLLKLSESLKAFSDIHSNAGADYYAVTSVCNSGLYEADFGWGKPIWSSIGNGSADTPILTNLIFLMDTKSGDGIEAWVTLSEEDMAILECDPELLSFASLDPSPLLLDNPASHVPR